MPDDVSRACACFLIILAYTLGAQDMRNVTTRVGTWHPGGLRFGLRLPVRRDTFILPTSFNNDNLYILGGSQ